MREGTEVETTHTWTTGSTFEFDEDGVHDEKEKDGERTEPWLTPRLRKRTNYLHAWKSAHWCTRGAMPCLPRYARKLQMDEEYRVFHCVKGRG